ncbi:PREDICTED: phosphoinositide 3-kinase regulatory subunit 6 isoform X5 [Bison bison bison]|uniref:Phosphoinositide 3-kinase regulatory subunit 6 isoform X5 n=1 Tax=Bison bison bison TaxID=43346 RepID=A0A6P3HEB9_BISBB|nr:PREDICTED: phosphoinositide 3-kinase regulatory subunit 6 isoform X5 [Bison bison bison]
MESSDVELDLQRSVQAVLRELSAQAPALQSNRGMWRWSLHKKVERDPGKSPMLVRILLRELEKAESEDARHIIIPLLHTLMYVLTKAARKLQQLLGKWGTGARDSGTGWLKQLLCRDAVPEAGHCRAEPDERAVPLPGECPAAGDRGGQRAADAGGLHAPRGLPRPAGSAGGGLPCRRAAKEAAGDSLQDEPLSVPLPSPRITFHLWTDEEQLWKELVLFLRPQTQLRLSADLEALDLQGLLPDWELARASMLSTDSGIERDLPLGADELLAPGSPEAERAGLQRKGGIKKRVWPADIVMPGSWDGPPGLHRRTGRPSGDGELLPGVSRLHTARVLVLGDDRMLGRLARAYRNLRKRETQRFCLTPRLSLQLYYIPLLAPETSAASRRSELGELAAFLGRADPWYEGIVNSLWATIHKLAEMPLSLDTSQTVDPFILDAITYYVRMGTQPVYFQIYTVKIFSGDLSQDPAEDIFLTELKVKIQDSKFPKDSFSPRRRGMAEGPGAELSICYQKALLSHRTREVTVSLRATGLVLKTLPASDTEVSGPTLCTPTAAPDTDHMCLKVSVTEIVKTSNLAGRSFSVVTNTFRTANIQIQSQDRRLLTLLLDKDSCRTYKDVVRFEVAPCPEPCSRTQKSKVLGLSSHQQEMERNKAKAETKMRAAVRARARQPGENKKQAAAATTLPSHPDCSLQPWDHSQVGVSPR